MGIEEIKGRLLQAYNSFQQIASVDEKRKIDEILRNAHTNAQDLLDRKSSTMDGVEFAHAWSMLQNNQPSLIENKANYQNSLPFILPTGDIFDFGKYECLDPGWIESVIQWLNHYNNRVTFSTNPASIRIPDIVSIAIAGDWGTGKWEEDAPSQKVANAIKTRLPDYTIHLGDVYYAGASSEESQNFLSLWPNGSQGTFTLNSNHEMYSGGFGYFDVVLKDNSFFQQNGTSYFSLENNNWIIVGLDSAYFASKDDLFQIGDLGSPTSAQIEFLNEIGNRAQAEHKKVIALTHHQGLDLTGKQQEPLWTQVTSALNGTLAYWYWGHIHAAIAYKVVNGVRCRCCGHGAIPYGRASILDGREDILDWRESDLANNADVSKRILNGFALLRFDGASLFESFIDENNVLRKTL